MKKIQLAKQCRITNNTLDKQWMMYWYTEKPIQFHSKSGNSFRELYKFAKAENFTHYFKGTDSHLTKID